MNLQPINPYYIIEQLKAKVEALQAVNDELSAENEALKAEVAEYVNVADSDNG